MYSPSRPGGRLFALSASSAASASTDHLAERLGLHPNGVRTHLQRMRDAGVVIAPPRDAAARPPRDEWAIARTPGPAAIRPAPTARSRRWLARTIPATPARLREVEDAGREIGRELAAGAATDPEQAIGDVLAALGFAPEVQRRREGWAELPPGQLPLPRLGAREPATSSAPCTAASPAAFSTRLAPTATLSASCPTTPTRPAARSTSTGSPRRPEITHGRGACRSPVSRSPARRDRDPDSGPRPSPAATTAALSRAIEPLRRGPGSARRNAGRSPPSSTPRSTGRNAARRPARARRPPGHAHPPRGTPPLPPHRSCAARERTHRPRRAIEKAHRPRA